MRTKCRLTDCIRRHKRASRRRNPSVRVKPPCAGRKVRERRCRPRLPPLSAETTSRPTLSDVSSTHRSRNPRAAAGPVRLHPRSDNHLPAPSIVHTQPAEGPCGARALLFLNFPHPRDAASHTFTRALRWHQCLPLRVEAFFLYENLDSLPNKKSHRD